MPPQNDPKRADSSGRDAREAPRLSEAMYRELVEILAIGTDISERLRIDGALRESEEKFRSAFANATVGFAMTDPSGRFLDANAAYCRITGRTIDELRALRFQDLIHPQDSAENVRLIDRMLSGRISDFAVDNRYLRKDGDSVWVHKNVSLVRAAGGEPKWILALIQDITAQKRAEESMLQSEARLRALAEGLPEIVWTANTRGDIEWFNRRFYEYTGEDVDPAGESGWSGIVHPDDLAPTVATWEKSVREGTLFEHELRTRGRDGGYRWFLVRAWPMLDPEGRIVRWFGTSTDIHRLKETEAALRQSREDFTRAQEVGQIGWWRLDLRKDILTWSDENYRTFGIPAGTPMNYEKFLATVHPEDRDQVDRAWRAGIQSGSYAIEHRILAGGETRWVRAKAYPEFDGEGSLLGGFGISQDITERMKAEQEVRRLNETLERRVAERTAEVRQQADQLRALANQLSQAELRERQEFAFEAAVRMRDRFLQQEVWDRMGVDPKVAAKLVLQAPQRQVFQSMLFSKIVPNCKKLGLLDAGDGWLRQKFGELGVIQFEDLTDTSDEYEAFALNDQELGTQVA